MKTTTPNLLWAVVSVGLLAVVGYSMNSHAQENGEPTVGPGCVAGGDPFSLTTLREIVSFLASDELAGRAPGTPGDEAARQYIEDRFRCLGLETAQRSFRNSERRRTANVVAVLRGSDPDRASEIVVIGAHHDHLGVERGRIFNGANDNASGIAALLAMAEAIKQNKLAPKRTIAFVAFGSEEEDRGGSELFVRQSPSSLPIDDVVHMINLDMVGYSPDGSIRAGGAWEGTPARAALEDLVGDSTLRVELGARVDADDQTPFCRAGIPFTYFAIDTDDDRCWHRSCDEIDRVDFEYLSAVSQLSYELLVNLADSDVDLLAARNAYELGCG